MEKRGQASRVEAQKKQAFEMQPITSENPRAVQGGLGRRPILKKVGQKLLSVYVSCKSVVYFLLIRSSPQAITNSDFP